MSAALALMLLATGPADREADIAALRDAKLNDWPRFYRENDADGLSAFLANIFVRAEGRWRPKFSHTSKAACLPLSRQ